MMYGRMPLYPALRPGCEDGGCVTIPLFGSGTGGQPGFPCCGETQRVMLENPCRPGERAEVLLGVDSCGNLAVCVRRERDACPPRPRCRPHCPPPRPRCGRLYGNWED